MNLGIGKGPKTAEYVELANFCVDFSIFSAKNCQIDRPKRQKCSFIGGKTAQIVKLARHFLNYSDKGGPFCSKMANFRVSSLLGLSF